jgi:UDP-N-acetylmuramoyl-L-alanyl-D-glutamate--2,6-diaminopimelate ligase
MTEPPVRLDQHGRWHLTSSVTGVQSDSRRVGPGNVFVAIQGHNRDGHDFLQEAESRGAIAAVVERPVGPTSLPILEVPSTRQAEAALASEFYGHPATKLSVIGVTGTNGKTSVVYWLRHLLEGTHHPAGMLSSVENLTGLQHAEEAHLTTPRATEVQAALAEMVARGLSYAVIEVSSHGLVQSRVDCVPFRVAILTNITREHLDYHKTMDNYVDAKARLFVDLLVPRGVAILNADDPYAPRIAQNVKASVMTYGVARGDVRGRILAEDAWHTTVAIERDGGPVTHTVHIPFPGRYNVYNVLAAWTAGLALGLEPEQMAGLIPDLPEVPGRFQVAAQGDGVTVLVDYAHTPDGLTQVLQTVRGLTGQNGRLWLVFGARGGRDRGKRPIMGAVAGRLADEVVLTADSPNMESEVEIANELALGIGAEGKRPFAVQLDRQKAIALAVDSAAPGDIVVITGRGPEAEQYFGSDRIIHMDDRNAAAAAMSRRLERKA